ncbi:Ubiquitin- modifier 1 [Tulasnella sp. 427]|nr:Ubiquitin- modifier 1 [Tulasnella sp. 427]
MTVETDTKATPSAPDTTSKTPTLNIKLEFGGGMELLFSNKRSHRVSVPSQADDAAHRPADVDYLIRWMRDNILTERVELFMEGDTVRPGILVMINDVDWELEGEGEYVLKEGDEVVFISTLHGG